MRHIGGRAAIAVAGAIACVGMAVPAAGAGAAAATGGSRGVVAQQAVPLTVVTYNIRHGIACVDDDGDDRCDDPAPPADIGAIAEMLVAMDPDVVVLQEVDQYHPESQCRNQPRFVQAALERATGEQWQFRMGRNKWVSTAGTACADENDRWARGNAVLSRHEIVRAFNAPLPQSVGDDNPDPCPVTQDTGRAHRCRLSAVIRVPGAGEVRVSTTHLSTDRAVRAEQVDELVDRWPPSEQPEILAGDLNLQPQGGLHDVLEGAGWVDSWKELLDGSPDCPNDGTTGCTHTSIDPRARIDYLLHSPSIEAVDATVGRGTASDHLPVRVELALPAAGAG